VLAELLPITSTAQGRQMKVGGKPYVPDRGRTTPRRRSCPTSTHHDDPPETRQHLVLALGRGGKIPVPVHRGRVEELEEDYSKDPRHLPRLPEMGVPNIVPL